MDYSSATNEELEQLVNQKNGDAICELAQRCMYGTKGHEQNLTRAYQLLHKGEKQGLAGAYLGLAEMYKKGLYFAKNEEVAEEYYKKSGMMPPSEPEKMQHKKAKNSQSDYINTVQTTEKNLYQESVMDISSKIRNKIKRAENARKNQDFRLVKKECNEAIHMLDSVLNGTVPFSGAEDLDVLKADIYWVLAFAAFNEQHVSELEEYMARGEVQALHPWGVYLVAVMHQNTKAPNVVMEQDLQNLMMICQNQNLTLEEEGDVCVMIGDLLAEGFGQSAGCTVGMAYEYYQKAVACGNEYAKEQLARR